MRENGIMEPCRINEVFRAVTKPPIASGEPIPVIPDHTMLKRIGRGSYGEVWLARCALGLLRAVKIVSRSRFRERAAYEQEFSAILRMEPLSRSHEGLVDILHVGRHEPEGCYYYVMELADNAHHRGPVRPAGLDTSETDDYAPLTLARELKRKGRLTPEECVQLGVALGSALNFLHQHGFVHRDLKPSNIIFVNGQPKLADIGLVGDAGKGAAFVGTEGYIPPEGQGTLHADLYSLGKVLYEACTGLDRLDFPSLPASLGPEHSETQIAEINQVVLKACARDPRQRYQTAAEFLADLELLQSGRSLRQHRKRARQKRLGIALAGVGILLAGFGMDWMFSWFRQTVALRSDGGGARRTAAQKPQAIDLSRFYNASLGSNWLHDFPDNDLGALPAGWQPFGKTCFDVRGLIQLGGSYTRSRGLQYPLAVERIPVEQKCARLHFLHGVVWPSGSGTQVGGYIVHYTGGRAQEIPLLYGYDLLNWWWNPAKNQRGTTLPPPVWVGSNGTTRRDGGQSMLRLFSLSWSNPLPEITVESIDFVSSGKSSCPFLIGITAE